ncbi:hypothetical protein D5086_028689, partial [Populus alba]
GGKIGICVSKPAAAAAAAREEVVVRRVSPPPQSPAPAAAVATKGYSGLLSNSKSGHPVRRTPVDIVRQTRDLLIYADQSSASLSDSKREEKGLLTSHKSTVAEFLSKNYDWFFAEFNSKLLESTNYITRRQAVKVSLSICTQTCVQVTIPCSRECGRKVAITLVDVWDLDDFCILFFIWDVLDSLSEFLQTAVEAAKRAGEIIREGFYQTKHVEHKGLFSFAGFLSSLGKKTTAACGITELTDEPTWIVDPLDGTTNFVHGFPFVCISIGLTIGKVPTVGVVYNPIMEELFTGVHGKGAFLNGKPIKVSSQSELVKISSCNRDLCVVNVFSFYHVALANTLQKECFKSSPLLCSVWNLVKTPFYFKSTPLCFIRNHVRKLTKLNSSKSRLEQNVTSLLWMPLTNRINSLLFKVRSLRMTGLLCIESLRSLHVEGLICFMKPDMEARGGAVIVKEAGGIVYDPSGKDFDITTQRVAASKPAFEGKHLLRFCSNQNETIQYPLFL